MSTEVVVSLPDETYRRALRLADLVGRQIDDVLSETLTISLPNLADDSPPAPLSGMSDMDVMALADSQMAPNDDDRFRHLLASQQNRSLDEAERAELSQLTEVYQLGLLRKAQALRECVQRGLRDSLQS